MAAVAPRPSSTTECRMRVRALHSLTILRGDGACKEEFEAGQAYEVTRLLGISLITEGWAVSEAPATGTPAAASDSPDFRLDRDAAASSTETDDERPRQSDGVELTPRK